MALLQARLIELNLPNVKLGGSLADLPDWRVA
jgi:hypothetical protein